MTTWAQHLAADVRRWGFVAKIEGVGRALTSGEISAGATDGRYRFCTAAPTYAGTATEPATLWRELLAVLEGENAAELPDILAEEMQPEGGIADRSASVRLQLLDDAEFLTGLLTVDVAPVTSLSVATASATTVFAPDTAAAGRIAAGDVVFVGGEAMRVTAVPGSSGSSSIDVERGYLSTPATPHEAGSACYLATPFLGGRRLELYVVPLDGDDATTEQLVGRFVIDAIEWDEGLNVWLLDARSEVEAFEGTLPEAPWAAEGFAFPGGLPVVTTPEALPTADWGHLHLLTGSEVVRGVDSGAGQILLVDERGVAETPESGSTDKASTLRRVLVPNPGFSDFRYSPGPSPSTSRASGTWNEIFDPIGLLLCVMTSSRVADDGLELTNYVAARGNYSSLPVGYGLGIPAADIDFDSFFDVQARLPDVRLLNLVLGVDPKPAGKWIDEHILRPLQLHLVINAGQYRLTKIRAPLVGQTLPQVDADAILVHEDGALPDVQVSRDIASQAKRVEFLLGPEKTPAVSQVANPTRTRRVVQVPVPGATVAEAGQQQLWQGFATSLSRQGYRPRSVANAAVDASLWAVLVGSLVEVTLPEAPDLATGARGWMQRVAQCLYREVRADTTRGVYLQTRFRIYNDGQLARRIAPAAWVSSVSGNDAVCKANRYTEADATGGLPTQDVAAFTVGDVVKLVNPDGTSAGGTTETVDGIDTGAEELQLSGNFGGNLAADTIVIFAAADDATSTQFALHAWLADNDFRVGTSDAAPTYYEEA